MPNRRSTGVNIPSFKRGNVRHHSFATWRRFRNRTLLLGWVVLCRCYEKRLQSSRSFSQINNDSRLTLLYCFYMSSSRRVGISHSCERCCMKYSPGEHTITVSVRKHYKQLSSDKVASWARLLNTRAKALVSKPKEIRNQSLWRNISHIRSGEDKTPNHKAHFLLSSGFFLNNSDIDAVLNKRQPGNSPRKSKQASTFSSSHRAVALKPTTK